MPFLSGNRPKGGWFHGRSALTPQESGGMIAGNWLLLLALWLAGVALIDLGGPQRYVGVAEGQRAPATVVAAVDFTCVNLAATELLRQQAAKEVVPVFAVQPGPLQSAWRMLDKLADRASASRRELDPADAKSESLERNLSVAADLLGLSISGEALANLFPPGKEMDVGSSLKASLESIWMGGIVSESDRSSGFQGITQSSTIDVLQPKEGRAPTYRTLTLDDLPTAERALAAFVEDAQPHLADLGSDATEKTLAELVQATVRPNLDFEERLTEERRDLARRAVKRVDLTVWRGTTLMEAGTTVTAQAVEMVNAYNQRMGELETSRERWLKKAGNMALMLVVLVVCAGWLHGTQPGVYSRARRKWLLVLLALLAIGIASLFRYVSVVLNWIPPWLVSFSVPVALATMLAALLLGPSAALAIGLWSSLSAALVFDRNFELLLTGLGVSALAVVWLRGARKRSQVVRAGLAVGLLEALMALALAALYQQWPSTFLAQAATGIASGILTAFLALLALPLLEWLFQWTTDISLLELTDMSHPLLQRLALEAPGTYHHSLMVGAIGQAAANRIGANGLLVAVCANFHDIGKLAKPDFFMENQRGRENPHDSLAPSMSALVIQSHVKEGLMLAKRYKLPRLVYESIRTHHGTALTSYFYHVARRALKEADVAEDAGLENSFRYDGPKPSTREQAVLMLADTVEAASRSLEKAMPNRIAEMVDTLLRDKLLDGQLDRCPLTLEDLHEIRASFVFSLTNILHGRNPYPREDPLAQPAKNVARPTGGVPAAGPSAGRPGVSA
jgi:hypothetical protein